MIILFSKNIAFIRTQKTGSTSIERTMRTFVQEGDMATWDRFELLENINNPHNLNPHSTGRQAEAAYREKYKGCFSFAVERNPFDRIVSDFHWKKTAVTPDGIIPRFRIDENTTFEKFIKDRMFTKNFHLYHIQDERMSVDCVVSYENMQSIIPNLFGIAGFDFKFPTEKIKASKEREDYKSYYNDELIGIVYEEESIPIKMFGYDFSSKMPKNMMYCKNIQEKTNKIKKAC